MSVYVQTSLLCSFSPSDILKLIPALNLSSLKYLERTLFPSQTLTHTELCTWNGPEKQALEDVFLNFGSPPCWSLNCREDLTASGKSDPVTYGIPCVKTIGLFLHEMAIEDKA